MPDIFWWDSPKTLITLENWKQFIPRNSTIDIYNLNSIARFILYLGIISWIVFQKQEIILFTIIGLMFTVLLYNKFIKNGAKDNSNNYLDSTNNDDVDNDLQIYHNLINSTSINRAININNDRNNNNNSDNCNNNNNNNNNNNRNDDICNIDPRFQIPEELFDMEQGKLNVKPVNETDKLISKGVESNGLPNDNMPNMGVIPEFDLRPGSNSENNAFNKSESLFLKSCEISNDTVINGRIRANNLESAPAPLSALQDAFKMGDRLGDNIRRDSNIHCAKIDFEKTPNNVVCGIRNPNLGVGGAPTPGSCSISAKNEALGSCGPCKFSMVAGCQMATPNNPFGNVLPTDNVGNPGKKPSCLDRDDTDNKWTISASPFAASFSSTSLKTPGQGLFRNVDDVWDRNNGQMAYNTLPSTTIPNDQDAYLKFLYHVPYVCKDGDLEACYGIDEMQTRKAGQILGL